MNPEQLQHQLDRLADEELSTEQQRELFSLLDRTPGGWRQCALTLLEARCWQRALSHWAQDHLQPPAPTIQRSPQPLGGYPSMRRLEHLAWATVAVALLAVGMAVGRWFPRLPAVPAPHQQVPLAQRQPAPKVARVPNTPPSLVAETGNKPRSGAHEPTPGKLSPPSWQGFWGWQDTTPEGQPVHRLLPAAAAATLDGPALRPEDVFPRQWLQVFQSLGHRVQVRRHWQAVPAADGTEVLIPRYEIHVVPVQAAGIQ